MKLLRAKVGHAREKPARNRFEYFVFYIDCPVTAAPIPHPKLISFERFNLMGLFRQDHGARDQTSWRSWFETQCAARGITIAPEDSVRLISHPRLFGYAFNPISFWLHTDKDGVLRTVLCEVNNTFGSSHNYLLAHEDHRPILPSDIFTAKKNLYVSPFNTTDGYYQFSFTYTPATFKAVINYFVGDERVLSTFMGGEFSPLTTGAILKSICLYPFMTVLVVARIHWQAVRLRFKGVQPTIHTMPPDTQGGTTHNT